MDFVEFIALHDDASKFRFPLRNRSYSIVDKEEIVTQITFFRCLFGACRRS